MQCVLGVFLHLFQLLFLLLPSLSDESNAHTAPQIFLSVLFNICCRSPWNHIHTHTRKHRKHTHTHSQLRTEQKLVLYNNVSSNAVAALQLISWVGLEECCRSTFLEKNKEPVSNDFFRMLSQHHYCLGKFSRPWEHLFAGKGPASAPLQLVGNM